MAAQNMRGNVIELSKIFLLFINLLLRKMNTFVEAALKTFCSNHEMFGESSVFVRFEEELTNEGHSRGRRREGLNSCIVFGKIVYRNSLDDNEERISPPLMLKMKTPKPFTVQFQIVQFFNEIAFHTRALPLLRTLGNVQPLFAELYDSYVRAHDDCAEFLLIFEDLRAPGFRTHERFSFLDADHLLLMLRQLGHWHAYSYRAKAKCPRQFRALGSWLRDSFVELGDNWHEYIRIFADRGFDSLRPDPLYGHRLPSAEGYLDRFDHFLRRLNVEEENGPLSVLCHGDYLRGNVMFRRENGRPEAMKMIDAATARMASPAIDLCIVLYLNADQDTRNRHWDRLIGAYYEGLCEPFGADGIPSRRSIMDEFRGRAMYAYFMASFFLPRTISYDRGLPNLEELLPPEYADIRELEIPDEVYRKAAQLWGGDESNEALANILRDMIDRDFI